MYRPLGNRLLDDEDEDDEAADGGHIIRLTIKNSHQQQQQQQQRTEFIYYTPQPGDTLHNISVRFSCPVAAIKRLNNLWSEQDFYGLTKLKLPVGKLRLITELIESPPPPPSPQQSSPELAVATTSTAVGDQNVHHHHQLLSGIERQFTPTPLYQLPDPSSSSSSFTNNDNQQGGDQIFKNVDTNIETARRAASSYENHASEIMQSLAQGGNLIADENDYNKRLDPKRMAQREAETLLNDMTDYGLSYNGLILFVFIVCLICPLAYVIYLEETHHTTIEHATVASLSSNKQQQQQHHHHTSMDDF